MTDKVVKVFGRGNDFYGRQRGVGEVDRNVERCDLIEVSLQSRHLCHNLFLRDGAEMAMTGRHIYLHKTDPF